MLEIQTLSTASLIALGDLFLETPSVDPNKELDYDGRYKKRISANFVKKYVTPLALTYWFMCDGSKGDWTPNEGKQIHLHTQSFTLLEVECLCQGLKNRYNLDAYPGNNKKRKIVKIAGPSYENFLSLVDKELWNCYRGRLPSPRKKPLAVSITISNTQSDTVT